MQNMKDLTTGNLWKKMLLFSIPLVITNLLQAVYNIVDMVIVGKFVGSAGLSAVSLGGQVTQVVLCIVLGIANSSAVIIAQLVGAKRQNEIKSTVQTMILFFTAAAVIITIVVFALAGPIMSAMHTPEESFSGAVIYLRTCVLGTICIYWYNLMNGVFRGFGNSKTPMILVLISAIVNIVLDLLFVAVFSMGVFGSALATVIAQLVIVVSAIRFINKQIPGLWKDISFKSANQKVFGTMVKIGLPQSVQFSLTNLSFLFISGLVNMYGVEASAAAGSVTKLGNFAVLAAQAIMSAIITMTGQNMGAKQYDRIIKGLGTGILYAIPIPIIFYFFCLGMPERMLGIFTKDPAVLTIGASYLQIVAISFMIESVMFCMMGVLTGAGYTQITLLCAVLSAFAVRYLLARVFSLAAGLGFMGIAMAYPFAPVASVTVCVIFLLSGKWKNNRIRV